MELRTVNTFLHIAELHSFSRTARQLGYSQSAVSSQIAQLEAELGTPLFDRVGKTVRLTMRADLFRLRRTLLETASRHRPPCSPPSRCGAVCASRWQIPVCSTFLPELLQRYHARCPQVELVLHTASSDEMLQLLSTNQVDLVYTLDQPFCSLRWCWLPTCRSRYASLHRRSIRWRRKACSRWTFCPGRSFCSPSGA